MLISCPKCTTNFSVPDKALGATGRNLKCAKCGHKWFQTPAQEEDFGLDEMSLPPTPSERNPVMEASAARVERPSSLDEYDERPAPARAAAPDLDFDVDEPTPPDFGPSLDVEGEKMEIDLDSMPPPPPMFGETKKGTGGLWVLLLLLILGGLGGGVFYYQDLVVRYWPPAHDLLAAAGLRAEKPGAGLEFRPAGAPERFVNNDVEVLIMRGVVANVSERVRPVPAMKLLLLDKDKNVVQEKLTQPPVSQLDPGGTSGFRIILEKPDPNAVEVNVVFVDPAEKPSK